MTARLTLGLIALLLVLGAVALPRSIGTEAQEPITPGTWAARGVATDPTNPGTVYVGLQTNTASNSGGQGIWKSTQYGAPGTFTRVDNGFFGTNGVPMWIGVDQRGYVYATNVYSNTGVLRSQDGGVTWVSLHMADINNVAIDPNDPTHLLAAFHSRHDICGPECDTGVLESVDDGLTWVQRPTIPGSGWGQYVHFVTSTTWIVTTQGHGVHRTTNSGASWTKVLNPSSVAYGDILRVGSAIYTGLEDGIYRSTNDGATWTKVLNETTPDVYMGLAKDSTGRLYAHSAYPFGGFGGGPFKTSTDGITWTNLGTQSFTNGPNQMASDGQYVYAAIWNLGIWRFPYNVSQSTPTATLPAPTATFTPVSSHTPTATSVPPSPTSTVPVPSSTPTSTPPDICHEALFKNGTLVQGPVRLCP